MILIGSNTVLCMVLDAIKLGNRINGFPWDSHGSGNKNVDWNGNGMDINIIGMGLHSHHVISNSHFYAVRHRLLKTKTEG